MSISNVLIEGKRPFKQILTGCHVVHSVSMDACPGGSQVNMAQIVTANRICKTSTYNRGWGTGCLIWGLGSVGTCVEVSCSEHHDISILSDSVIMANTTMTFQTERDTKLMSSNVPQTFSFGVLGTAVMTCQLETDRTATLYYHLREANGMKTLVLKDVVDQWPGMFKMGSHVGGMNKVVVWGETRPNEIMVSRISEPTCDWNSTVTLKERVSHISFVCDIVLDKLITDNYPVCEVNVNLHFIQNGSGSKDQYLGAGPYPKARISSISTVNIFISCVFI